MTHLKEDRSFGLDSLVRSALGKMDPETEDYYKLKGMIEALETAKLHGVVVAKGSPFYGMTELELQKEIDEIAGIEGEEEKGDEDPLRILAQQARDFATSLKKERHLPIAWQAQMIQIINLADDLDTSIALGQRERAIRLGQELEILYDRHRSIFGDL